VEVERTVAGLEDLAAVCDPPRKVDPEAKALDQRRKMPRVAAPSIDSDLAPNSIEPGTMKEVRTEWVACEWPAGDSLLMRRTGNGGPPTSTAGNQAHAVLMTCRTLPRSVRES
jgi:hypothetical protein